MWAARKLGTAPAKVAMVRGARGFSEAAKLDPQKPPGLRIDADFDLRCYGTVVGNVNWRLSHKVSKFVYTALDSLYGPFCVMHNALGMERMGWMYYRLAFRGIQELRANPYFEFDVDEDEHKDEASRLLEFLKTMPLTMPPKKVKLPAEQQQLAIRLYKRAICSAENDLFAGQPNFHQLRQCTRTLACKKIFDQYYEDFLIFGSGVPVEWDDVQARRSRMDAVRERYTEFVLRRANAQARQGFPFSKVCMQPLFNFNIGFMEQQFQEYCKIQPPKDRGPDYVPFLKPGEKLMTQEEIRRADMESLEKLWTDEDNFRVLTLDVSRQSDKDVDVNCKGRWVVVSLPHSSGKQIQVSYMMPRNSKCSELEVAVRDGQLTLRVPKRDVPVPVPKPAHKKFTVHVPKV